MSSKEIMRWGDDAMYSSQPMQKDEQGRIGPQVALLVATPDPLGAIGAGMRMFRGDPVMSLDEITDDERRWAWEESIKGHLKAPWEFVDFTFMIEGVTRAFTHQIVRQRTAVYAQESLRFAVKENLADEIPKPPMVVGDETAEAFWNQAVRSMERSYHALISLGIPAEDARGLLPHATTTRLIYKTNFRGLMEHAGNRLCTQAQFEWRAVFMGIMNAIYNYESGILPRTVLVGEDGKNHKTNMDGWQFKIIAQHRPETFAPVCYQLGRCPFMSELDRGCTIRDRVQTNSEIGRPAAEWDKSLSFDGKEGSMVAAIHPAEWMANPRAGITDDEENRRPD
jgi:flavin-dependent thymidylate synthase